MAFGGWQVYNMRFLLTSQYTAATVAMITHYRFNCGGFRCLSLVACSNTLQSISPPGAKLMESKSTYKEVVLLQIPTSAFVL